MAWPLLSDRNGLKVADGRPRLHMARQRLMPLEYLPYEWDKAIAHLLAVILVAG